MVLLSLASAIFPNFSLKSRVFTRSARRLSAVAAGSMLYGLLGAAAMAQQAPASQDNPSPYTPPSTYGNTGTNGTSTQNVNSYGAYGQNTGNTNVPTSYGPSNNQNNYSGNCGNNNPGNSLSSYAPSGGNCSEAAHQQHQRIELALDESLGYDTNPGLSPLTGSTASSFTSYTGGSLFLYENMPRLKLLVGATGGYEEYFGNSQYNYLSGTMDSRAEYAIIPEHFYWTASDTYGQDATNAFAPATSNNITNVNLFATGPQLVEPLGDNLKLNVGGTVGTDRYAGEPSQDNDRFNFNAGLTHSLSHFESVSLDGTYQRVDFTDASSVSNLYPVSSDYSIENVFVQWFEGTVRNDMVVDLGEGRVIQQGKTFSSPTVHINLNRQTWPHWHLGVVLISAYSDTAQQIGNSLVNNRSPAVGGNPLSLLAVQEQLVAQPIKTDQISFNAKYNSVRTEFTAGMYMLKEQYLDDPIYDTTNYGISGRYTRRLSFRTDFSLSAGMARIQYGSTSASETTEDIGPTLSWHSARNFRVSTSVNYERRSATYNAYGYNDLRIFVNLRWSPFHSSGYDQSPSSFGDMGGGSSAMFNVPGAQY